MKIHIFLVFVFIGIVLFSPDILQSSNAEFPSEVYSWIEQKCFLGLPPKEINLHDNLQWGINKGDYYIFNFLKHDGTDRYRVSSSIITIIDFSPNKSEVLIFEYNTNWHDATCSWHNYMDLDVETSDTGTENLPNLRIYPISGDGKFLAQSFTENYVSNHGGFFNFEENDEVFYGGISVETIQEGTTVPAGDGRTEYIDPTKESSSIALNKNFGIWSYAGWTVSGEWFSEGYSALLIEQGWISLNSLDLKYSAPEKPQPNVDNDIQTISSGTGFFVQTDMNSYTNCNKIQVWGALPEASNHPLHLILDTSSHRYEIDFKTKDDGSYFHEFPISEIKNNGLYSLTIFSTDPKSGDTISKSKSISFTRVDPSECGGCLIATATYGSELASEVQMLREIRDHQLLQTESGSAFMVNFNSIYYSFAPTIAQWENESPIFKQIVKTTITPLITSLSLLKYVNMDSEVEVLTYGLSMITLNLCMYFVAPALIIHKLRQYSILN